MQEINLDNSVNTRELELSNFSLEVEKFSDKSRVVFYISKKVNYERKENLEVVNSNIIIFDIKSDNPIRLINV